MGASPLHRLAHMISAAEYIDDETLVETLGHDATIVVPLHGGAERRLPSGEILSVLAEGAGVSVDQVLSLNFRMDKAEIESANAFIRLVQFAGDELGPSPTGEPEQPFQPIDQ